MSEFNSEKPNIQKYLSEMDQELPGVWEEMPPEKFDALIQAEQKKQEELDAREPGSHFADVQELITPDQLSILIKSLKNSDTDEIVGATEYAKDAAALKDMDPEWFSKNSGDFLLRKKELWDSVKSLETRPAVQLELLFNLKRLSPAFWKEIEENLDFDFWDKIQKYIISQKGNWASFLTFYYQASFLNHSEISTRLDIKEFWPKIDEHFQALGSSYNEAYAEPYSAKLVSYAQALVPTGMDPIKIDQKTWLGCLDQLADPIRKYEDGQTKKVDLLKKFVSDASGIKILKVEGNVPKLEK